MMGTYWPPLYFKIIVEWRFSFGAFRFSTIDLSSDDDLVYTRTPSEFRFDSWHHSCNHTIWPSARTRY